MVYEKVQKGNPYQLTIKQHFHTAHAISKFYDINEKVDVFIKSRHEIKKLHKRNRDFYVKRCWDEKAEKGFMAKIEAKFHNEIDALKALEDRNHDAITEYGFLWGLRFHYQSKTHEDKALIGIPGTTLEKDTQELLEKRYIGFARDDSTVPYRQENGLLIHRQCLDLMKKNKGIKWGVVTTKDAELIVPDDYLFGVIPVSPNKAFIANSNDMLLSDSEVGKLNAKLFNHAKNYFFCRDISNCPLPIDVNSSLKND